MSDKPSKAELPSELRRLLNTLTDDAQNTAVRRFTETGLDPNKGQIPLQETLINLGETRDVLLDAIETGKFVQLPLKIQTALYDHVQAIARELSSLATGTDAVLNLEAAVEDLTAATWQYQLHNLTGEVLGFKTKMNQLKTQETKIREAARAADQFATLYDTAKQLAEQIHERATATDSDRKGLAAVMESIQSLVKTATEQSQAIGLLATQVESHDKNAGLQLASAKQAASDTEAIANKSKEMRDEIASSRDALQDLTMRTQTLLAQTETNGSTQLKQFEDSYKALLDTTEAETKSLAAKLNETMAQVSTHATEKLDALTSAAEAQATKFVGDANAKLDQAELTHATAVSDVLTAFASARQEALDAFAAKSGQSLTDGDNERKRLVTALDELEGRIRTAIERATGFTLFHAFQTRQLQIVRSKRLWGWALALCVVLSVGASGAFIWYYHDLQTVTPSFFLKLSISIPLIYAITFCNLQYSRERKLEEEYAFKSSVSISLDPYQRLVGGLIDKANTTEMAKYTEFIIQSVNRVFTSPTETVFDGKRDRASTDMVKAVGDAVSATVAPVIKALNR